MTASQGVEAGLFRKSGLRGYLVCDRQVHLLENGPIAAIMGGYPAENQRINSVLRANARSVLGVAGGTL